MGILSIAVWSGTFCLRSWLKTKFGGEMTGSQWRSSSWSKESWRKVCAHDDGIFVMDREKCLRGCVTKMCTLKKKVSDEQRKKEECSQSKEPTCKNRACKILAPKCQPKIACRVIALLAMHLDIEKEIVSQVIQGDKHHLRKSANCKAQISPMCRVDT